MACAASRQRRCEVNPSTIDEPSYLAPVARRVVYDSEDYQEGIRQPPLRGSQKAGDEGGQPSTARPAVRSMRSRSINTQPSWRGGLIVRFANAR